MFEEKFHHLSQEIPTVKCLTQNFFYYDINNCLQEELKTKNKNKNE